MRKKTLLLSRSDRDAAVRDALRLITPQVDGTARRRFMRQALSLGGLSMLSGCDITDQASVEQALARISRFNDAMQARLFSGSELAPTYPASMITRPFPFNAFYSEDGIPMVDESAWRLEVSGLVQERRAWRLADLRAMPYQEQITRHICVEGWSAIGRWGGVPFAHFLRRVGADLSAQYVGFKCADGYHTSIDMPTALHPQTIMAITYDGQPLPPQYGHPLKLRMPTKLGYKNPKYITAMYVTNTYPGGYWEDQGYNWFGGS